MCTDSEGIEGDQIGVVPVDNHHPNYLSPTEGHDKIRVYFILSRFQLGMQLLSNLVFH